MQSPPSTQSYKTSVLIIVSVGGFLAPFMSSAINIALPEIGTEFSADAVTLSWVASSFLLATAVFLIPFGRISDLHGREKIYIPAQPSI
jgi:MFS family permease